MESKLDDSHLATPSSRRAVTSSLGAALLALIVFAAITPTLTWLRFTNSTENLNVGTALEARRSGNWLVPTLNAETRLAKPPLTAWITAWAIRESTMHALSSPDSMTREAGFRSLGWQVRWPALLAACATLVITFHIGRLLADSETGLLAMMVLASCVLFLRFARYSTTDIHLMLWVAVTNLLLLKAVVRGQWWVGLVGGGLALALAMMAKGPVAILQSAIPIAAWVAVTRPRPRVPLAPLLTGAAVFLVVGLAWYVLVLTVRPDAPSIWYDELTGYAAVEDRSTRWYAYAFLIPYMIPWLVFFLAGLAGAAQRRSRSDIAALSLLFIPVLVMSFFHDRYDRYLPPMLPAAAVVTALVLAQHLRGTGNVRIDRALGAAHWVILLLVGVGLPILASGVVKEMRRVDGEPWLEPPIAAAAAGFALTMIVAAIVFQRYWRWAMPVATLAVMLGMQGLFMAGYSESERGYPEYRPLAEAIWSRAPDAEAFNARADRKRPPAEVGVYLNRVIRWVDDPSTLAPGDRPKALFMFQEKGEPPPTPPPGWIPLTAQGRWFVFILPRGGAVAVAH